jgi:AcrR family transcriptional regulator
MAQNKTRERIKSAAQRLIAEHGIDGVSVRDIVAAAGQKNMASLHYYFRNKDLLIKELLVDCIKLMERRRASGLRALAQSGRIIGVRELIAVWVRSSALEETDERSVTLMRFLTAMYPSHRRLIGAALGEKSATSYRKCLDMIRRRMGAFELQIVNQRLLFAATSILHLLAARESARAVGGRARTYWGGEAMLEHIVDAMYGLLHAPVSSGAMAAPASRRRPPAAMLRKKASR